MSEKNLDRSGRWRSRTVVFRVSDEEAAQIDTLVALSGLTKQEYCTTRLLQKDVVVRPSSRLQKDVARQADAVYRELRRMERAGDMPVELCELVEALGRVFVGLGISEESSDTEKESRGIRQMPRG